MWQTMDSAPRDGTPFLAYCKKDVERDGYLSVPDAVRKLAIVWSGHPNKPCLSG